MLRAYYFPRIVSEQTRWLYNYAEQLRDLGVRIGLQQEEVESSINDALHLAYSMGSCAHAVHQFSRSYFAALNDLKFGKRNGLFALPVFHPPSLPEGMGPVKPGALSRIFKFVKMIKAAPGYKLEVGLLLGVVGSEVTAGHIRSEGAPSLFLSLSDAAKFQQVSIKFLKEGHYGVVIECRRGDGSWESLGIHTKSPCIDARELLVPGQAEVREYRARFWDDGSPVGEWSPIPRIAVSP